MREVVEGQWYCRWWGVDHLQEAFLVFWVSLREGKQGGKGVCELVVEAWALLWNSYSVEDVLRGDASQTRFEFPGGAKNL